MSAKSRKSETSSVLKQNLLKLNTGNEIQTDQNSHRKRILPVQSVNDQQSSIPEESSDANKTKRRKQNDKSNKESPSKKVNRARSNQKTKGPRDAINNDNDSNSTFSDIVALNCKLTNEMLEMKKSLFQKTDALSQLEKNFQEKSVECIELKSKISEQEIKINSLENIIEHTKAEQFCDDLILFDDANQEENKPLVGEFSIAPSRQSGTDLIELMSVSPSADNNLFDDHHDEWSNVKTIAASVQSNVIPEKESEIIKSKDTFSWSVID